MSLVSIVIPCYGGSRYLAMAIESCLRQTYRELDVIVVDDASPDDCAEIAERFARSDSRVRVIRRPQNGGVSRAFNTGMEAARGAYLTRLAQDDIFDESAVDVMVRRLEELPEAGLVYCDSHVIDDEGNVIDHICVPPPEEVLAFRNRIGLCVMWRRAVWEQVGGFDPRFDTAEDFDYWLRIAQAFPITKCPAPAPFFVRAHQACGSKQFFEKQERATLEVVRTRFPSGSLRERFLKRKALANAMFSASTDYSAMLKQHVQAIQRVLWSLLIYPFPFKRDEWTPTLVRPKALVVYTMRWIGLRD